MLRCVYEGEQKWLWDSLGECYRYELDAERPNWQRQIKNRDVHVPSWIDEFFIGDIEEFQHQDTASVHEGVDDATRSRLEELGYL
jgi:hypothetical protein